MWNPEALHLYVKIICCFTNWQVPLQQYGTYVFQILNNIKLVTLVLWLNNSKDLFEMAPIYMRNKTVDRKI